MCTKNLSADSPRKIFSTITQRIVLWVYSILFNLSLAIFVRYELYLHVMNHQNTDEMSIMLDMHILTNQTGALGPITQNNKVFWANKIFAAQEAQQHILLDFEAPTHNKFSGYYEFWTTQHDKCNSQLWVATIQ